MIPDGLGPDSRDWGNSSPPTRSQLMRWWSTEIIHPERHSQSDPETGFGLGPSRQVDSATAGPPPAPRGVVGQRQARSPEIAIDGTSLSRRPLPDRGGGAPARNCLEGPRRPVAETPSVSRTNKNWMAVSPEGTNHAGELSATSVRAVSQPGRLQGGARIGPRAVRAARPAHGEPRSY
jgi:hypothetical protein